ncbi:MAG: site-specific integrase [Chloroflexota bacterium]|nr:MAG: site-specific integrase [Chloroflexota bacterium]
MNEEGFRSFLEKQRRSDGTVDQCVQFAREFEAYVAGHRDAKDLDEAAPDDLEAFASWNKQQRKSINSYLWAIHRYYEYTLNDSMRRRATDMRQQEIAKRRARRKPFRLKDIQGLPAEHVERLDAIGITDVEALLEAG